MDKFNRNYKLTIQATGGGLITVELPFTMEFNIVRDTLSSANTASIRIYNLAEETRRLIAKDSMDFGLLKKVTLMAGYNNDLSVIMSGDVSRCHSVREGTNFVTTIECFDAGYAFANATLKDAQYPSGTAKASIYKDLITKMKPFGVEYGSIGVVEGTIARGNSFTGNPINVLKEISEKDFFIDNGKAYLLSEDECLQGSLYLIDSSTGLLGTPVREQTKLTMDIIFEPRLISGQSILVKSDTAAPYNGEYKIVALRHSGIISGSVAGTAVTTVTCFIGPKKLRVVA